MQTLHIHRFSTCLSDFFNLNDAINQVLRTGVEIVVTEIASITTRNSNQQAFFTVLGTQEQVVGLQTIAAYLTEKGVGCYELGCPTRKDFLT